MLTNSKSVMLLHLQELSNLQRTTYKSTTEAAKIVRKERLESNAESGHMVCN